MIKRFNDYDQVQTYAERQQLPKGAYTLTIMGVKKEKYTNGSEAIRLMLDVKDGEYKGFYMNDWNAQTGEDKKWRCSFPIFIPKDDGTEKDGWTKRVFKTVISAIEESNNGYHWDWDENGLKGKTIGGLFNIREYKKNDGYIGSGTNLKRLISCIALLDGKYKLPDDDLLPKDEPSAQTFIPAEPQDASTLPF